MEIDKPRHSRIDSHQDQMAINVDDSIKELIQHLGEVGVDKAFTNFLQQDVLAQVVVGQLLDRIDGLQKEVTSTKCAAITLASRMTGDSWKQPASPTSRNLEDEE